MITPQRRALVAVLATGVVLLAALWLLAIGPARGERETVRANVAEQQARLDAATAQVADYGDARRQFPGLLAELRRLDRAVPSHAAIASLLRELQRRARVRGSDLRLAALQEGAAPAAAATGSQTAPAAAAGPGGLSALPFTFEYTGTYFDLLAILRAVRNAVHTSDGDLAIDGRLLTIDGLAFKRLDPDRPLTKAVVNATAYIAPDGPPTAPATRPTGGS